MYNVTKRNKKFGSQAPMLGFISDLETKTEKNLSKKIKIKASIIPTAKFKPIPPLFLKLMLLLQPELSKSIRVIGKVIAYSALIYDLIKVESHLLFPNQ